MSEFEAFDRNGAFSRSPQGGMDGRPEMNGMPEMNGRPEMNGGPEMMYGGEYGGEYGGNPNPFSRRGGPGNPNDNRMHTRDGFDPYSAYGSSFGMSQSDRGGPGPQGMEYYGQPGMMSGGSMMGGGGGEMNGVHKDNTMPGFSYSSRVREQQGGGGPDYEQAYDPSYDYERMGGGFDGPMMGGGMEYEQQGYEQQGYEQQEGFPGPNGGEYAGFDGEMDMRRMGP